MSSELIHKHERLKGRCDWCEDSDFARDMVDDHELIVLFKVGTGHVHLCADCAAYAVHNGWK